MRFCVYLTDRAGKKGYNILFPNFSSSEHDLASYIPNFQHQVIEADEPLYQPNMKKIAFTDNSKVKSGSKGTEIVSTLLTLIDFRPYSPRSSCIESNPRVRRVLIKKLRNNFECQVCRSLFSGS